MNWSFTRRMASRFISGEDLQDAIPVIKDLNKKNINASLDHLGEHTTSREEAEQATQDILKTLDEIDRSHVRSNVSIKLTQIGLAIDHDLVTENLDRILKHAREKNNYIRVDMEDSPVTQQTLDLVCEMQQRGYNNVGVVIQSYLYRSEIDIRQLVEEGISVRLCKGAYKEPADVAIPQKADVDRNYDRLSALLIDDALQNGAPLISEDGRIPPIPVIASHDKERIEFAKHYAEEKGLPKKAIEFQMLYGIRRDLQAELASQGYPVRVYVPYGKEWYPYYMRRLAERPANIWFFISNFFKN